MTANPTASGTRPGRLSLACLLVVSYGLRVWLALGGGQGYWPDEARYELSRNAAAELANGHWRLALVPLLTGADHVLFRWVGLPVAILERCIGGTHPAVVASYFGLFSVGAIFMVWAVALRAGATAPEALWAAIFSASANSLFYFARHFFPYDVSLFIMLVGLWLAVGPWSPVSSCLAGAAIGLGFLAYNGYWLLGACVLTLHSLLGGGGRRRAAARAALAFAGLAAPIVVFLALGAAFSGNVLHAYGAFASTVKQGDFRIGYKVVPEYLWSSEGLVLIFLLAAFGYALATSARGVGSSRLRWWGASVLFLYSGLVFFSDVEPIFVVYGRLSRSIVPFLCLGAGAGVARFIEKRGASRRAWSAAALVLVAFLAALNFAAPLRQVFPDRFLRIFAQRVSEVPKGSYNFYRVLYAESLWGRSLDNTQSNAGVHELLRLPNPMQFRPYQFEGYSEAQRLKLKSADVAMRVLEIPVRIDVADRWNGYPGPVKMTVTFPRNHQFLAEPLLCTGVAGKGDIIYVRYVDSRHVQFGHDHWGLGASESKPVEVDYDRPHELVISAGSLLPPPESGVYLTESWLALMRGHLLVMLDGRPVLSTHADFYPSSQKSILFGANLIGGSSTEPGFNGEVSDFKQASLDEVAPSIPVLAGVEIARDRPPEWAGAVGPVRIRFVLPGKALGQENGQPLASIVGPNTHQVLFIVRDGTKARIGFDSVGMGAVWSDPVDLSPSGADEMEVSVGALLPDAGAPVYGQAPNFVGMRNMIYATLNHKLALFAAIPFKTTGASKVVFGANIPGSSACAPFFEGEITSIEAIGLREVPVGRAATSEAMAKLARPGWNGYSGPLRIDLRFSEGRPGDCQPILTTGVTGEGDIVFVRYETDRMAGICVDHWGAPLTKSDLFPLTPGAAHVLTLGLSSLYPPEGSEPALGKAISAATRNRMLIVIDGKRILDCERACFPSRPEWLTIGANFIGGSSVGTAFFGSIDNVSEAPLEAGPR